MGFEQSSMRFYQSKMRFYQSIMRFYQSSMRFYQSKMRICQTFMIFNQFSWDLIKKCCMRFDHRFLIFTRFYQSTMRFYQSIMRFYQSIMRFYQSIMRWLHISSFIEIQSGTSRFKDSINQGFYR